MTKADQRFITDIRELCDYLELEPSAFLSRDTELANCDFPLQVTKSFLKRIKKKDPLDPLLRQILPSKEERVKAPGFSKDPLAETKVNPVPGLLHRYYGRVLLLLTNNCALHCRFCFRRHLPSLKRELTNQDLKNIFKYIADDTTISEVILSGGDPLTLSDKKLQNIFIGLSDIKHLKRLRIHTRLPVAFPERVSMDLVKILTSTRFSPIIVIHSNHKAEIDEAVNLSIQRLRSARIILLNQSVLLKGVNDSISALIELNEALGAIGVIPYYLHLLDKVEGASHFEVALKDAKILHKKMRERLPGYLVPRLIFECPTKSAKEIV
jgi:L-lysine 2,3-aminomutase